MEAVQEECAKLERVRTRFMEAVAHELRTPVTPLKSVIEMFLGGMLGEITPEQRKYLEMMQRNIERLKHFIDEVTSLSRLDSGESILHPERLSVLTMVHGVVELLKKKAKKKKIYMSLGTQTELFVWADPDALNTVVTNLIDNAVMHNPEGTTVKVATRLTGDNRVEVAVCDDGRGISREMQKDIFDTFSTSHKENMQYRGAGMGLAVCKALIERMDGKISVDSEPGEGTTFRFTLPVKPRTAALNRQQ
jgi:signal transduction histidine kinase